MVCWIIHLCDTPLKFEMDFQAFNVQQEHHIHYPCFWVHVEIHSGRKIIYPLVIQHANRKCIEITLLLRGIVVKGGNVKSIIKFVLRRYLYTNTPQLSHEK